MTGIEVRVLAQPTRVKRKIRAVTFILERRDLTGTCLAIPEGDILPLMGIGLSPIVGIIPSCRVVCIALIVGLW